MNKSATFGRYLLDRRLAIGGMAEVLLGRVEGPGGFEKKIVIKRILPRHATDQRYVNMFLDEARIAARFNHPNLIQIYELSNVDGQYAMAMEYIEGEDVSNILNTSLRRKRPVPFQIVAHIIAETAEGLHYAHELRNEAGEALNVVHRDVSPANIIVTWMGGVKVVDFGIAKHIDSTSKTEFGTLKGKIRHMSPEQATGDPVDRRSDLFSLGSVFYELLTLTHCFIGKRPIDTLGTVVRSEFRPPRQFRPDLPDEVERILRRMLARRREERYESAAELARDLRRYLASTDMPMAGDIADFMKALFEEHDEKSVRFYDALSSVMAVPVSSSYSDPQITVPQEVEEQLIAQAAHRRKKAEDADLLEAAEDADTSSGRGTRSKSEASEESVPLPVEMADGDELARMMRTDPSLVGSAEFELVESGVEGDGQVFAERGDRTVKEPTPQGPVPSGTPSPFDDADIQTDSEAPSTIDNVFAKDPSDVDAGMVFPPELDEDPLAAAGAESALQETRPDVGAGDDDISTGHAMSSGEFEIPTPLAPIEPPPPEIPSFDGDELDDDVHERTLPAGEPPGADQLRSDRMVKASEVTVKADPGKHPVAPNDEIAAALDELMEMVDSSGATGSKIATHPLPVQEGSDGASLGFDDEVLQAATTARGDRLRPLPPSWQEPSTGEMLRSGRLRLAVAGVVLIIATVLLIVAVVRTLQRPTEVASSGIVTGPDDSIVVTQIEDEEAAPAVVDAPAGKGGKDKGAKKRDEPREARDEPDPKAGDEPEETSGQGRKAEVEKGSGDEGGEDKPAAPATEAGAEPADAPPAAETSAGVEVAEADREQAADSAPEPTAEPVAERAAKKPPERSKPPRPGSLSLSSRPRAQVRIDGRRVGTTPVRKSLSPGTHVIELSDPKGGARQVLRLSVKPGERIKRRVVFPKGKVVINVQPWAEVYLDGKRLGTTPLPPFTIFEGTYKLKLSNPELGIERVKKIKVREGQVTKVTERF